VNLADVSAELYGLDPESFTATRNARAKEASAGGDRELAGAIRKLAKPTAAAWLANRLTRSRRSSIEELIGLGAELRRAQSSGQRAEMRRLVEQRRGLIGDLVKSASTGAQESGHGFGSLVERQLEETLEAAVADETLGAVLGRGQLSEPLRFVGFGEAAVFGSGAEAEGAESKAGPAGKAEPKAKAGKTKAGQAKARKAKDDGRRQAEAEARREAEAEGRAAQEALAAVEASVEKARVRAEAAEERLGRASKLMEEAEAEKAAAAAALRAARQGLGPARRRLKKFGGG
jgi:hypothetical protein